VLVTIDEFGANGFYVKRDFGFWWCNWNTSLKKMTKCDDECHRLWEIKT
jgi:hypothetical protein